MTYEALEKAITRWAAAEPGVQALVVIGSRAREDHPADAWSDLDLILFVSDPQAYVADTSWLADFGDVWLRVLNVTGAGDPEWLVLFAGGFKVDFILAPVTGRLNDRLADSFYAVAARRGFRILLDKSGEGLAETTKPAESDEWVQPDAGQFAAVLQQFWLSIYRANKMVLRGELWRARMILDGPIRQQILQLLAWHAKALNGNDFETWYDGRFLADWVEPQNLALLPELFAPFNSSGTKSAILAAMSLMNSLGRQTAAKWNYPYPIENQIRFQDWIESFLAGE